VCLPDLAVDGQPGGVAVGFEGLKHVLGVGVPGGPLEAGAQTRTASGLDREKLALVWGGGGFGGKSVGSWAKPRAWVHSGG